MKTKKRAKICQIGFVCFGCELGLQLTLGEVNITGLPFVFKLNLTCGKVRSFFWFD